jgi:ADP-ribose pyrophosphatase YjhB (NUDIX family)
MRALAERDAALVLSYQHTYEPQNPEARPGEADYLATYDLASFNGRDTSSDMVVLKPASHGRSLEVLMILRANHPYKGTWAHPGGFLNHNEPIVEGAIREAGEEANMKLAEADVEYVGHYDHPDRDPRGAVKMNVSMTFVPIGTTPRAGDDAKQSRFIPLAKIFDGSYPICGDHRLSIRDAVAHLLNVDVPPPLKR